jgi:hypothetical protein
MGLHRKPSRARVEVAGRDLSGGGGLQVGPEARRKLVTFISLGCAVGTM